MAALAVSRQISAPLSYKSFLEIGVTWQRMTKSLTNDWRIKKKNERDFSAIPKRMAASVNHISGLIRLAAQAMGDKFKKLANPHHEDFSGIFFNL